MMQHTLGSLFYSKEHELAYVNIPRVASTSIKNALNWQYYDSIDQILNNGFRIKTIFAVLRDPVERWESTMNMLVKNSVYRTDEHFMSQIDFVLPFNNFKDKAILFYLTDTILDDIANYFNLDINTTIRENESQKLIKVVDDTFIKENYYDDYTLINNANFINRPRS